MSPLLSFWHLRFVGIKQVFGEIAHILSLFFVGLPLLSCYGVALPNSGLERLFMQLSEALWLFFHIPPQLVRIRFVFRGCNFPTFMV